MNAIGSLSLMLAAVVACNSKGGEQKTPPDKAAVAPAETAPPAAKAKAVPAANTSKPSNTSNPAIAELAPLWPEIAKCEDTSDLYAQTKCPANFKLLEIAKAAYAAADQDPKRFGEVHEALVDQVVNGTDLKARSSAAYADWSKAGRGGKQYENNTGSANALLDALAKLPDEDGYVGYGIANMLGGWWKTDGEVRTRMIGMFGDKQVKSTSGRRELIRHASWVKQAPAIAGAFKAIAPDGSDVAVVRQAAIDGLSAMVAEHPDLVDTLLPLTEDAAAGVPGAAVRALGRLTPGTPQAMQAQVKLLTLATTSESEAARAAPTALAAIGEISVLGDFGAFYKANSTKPVVIVAYRDLVFGMAFGNRFKGDAAADAAMRRAIDVLVDNKVATAWDQRYMMQALGALGGPKSANACKRFESSKDASVADAAKKCSAKATAKS